MAEITHGLAGAYKRVVFGVMPRALLPNLVVRQIRLALQAWVARTMAVRA